MFMNIFVVLTSVIPQSQSFTLIEEVDELEEWRNRTIFIKSMLMQHFRITTNKEIAHTHSG